MIKGISRQMIEITETENNYFERAFLMVRPEYAQMERYKLENQAKKMLRRINNPSKIKKRGMFLFWLIRLGGSALVGATCMWLIQFAISASL